VTPRHLLVIDDEPFVGQVIRMLFEKGPFQVSIAHDGVAGLQFLREHPEVACAFVDINMPGLGGLGVLEQARREPALADVAFLVLSGAGDQLNMAKAQELGARAFVTKPFSPNKLYRQVTELLGVASELPGRTED
jgi:CheY-like chemotaxis protein